LGEGEEVNDYETSEGLVGLENLISLTKMPDTVSLSCPQSLHEYIIQTLNSPDQGATIRFHPE